MHRVRYLIFFIIFTGLLFSYGYFVEREMLHIKHIRVKNKLFSQILSGKIVVHITDLHFPEHQSVMLNSVNKQIKSLNPDYIFITGDFVAWDAGRAAYRQAVEFLSQLKANDGIYASLGDADYTSATEHCILCHTEKPPELSKKHAVTFLRDEKRTININGKNLDIIGLDSGVFPENLYKQTFTRIDSLPAVILSHVSLPFNWIQAKKNVLVLSGDTHGGQVYLPIWVWRLIDLKPDSRHMYGYFQDANKNLFVSDGIGTSRIPLRIGVPPQIAVLEFTDQ